VAIGVVVTQPAGILAPAVPVPGRWTFWADNLVAPNASLGQLDVSAFTCSLKRSDFGTGSVTLSMPCGLDPARVLQLWSWRMWALYNGQPVFCGVPTGITDDGTQQVVLTLLELPGYLAMRQMDVFPTKVYSQVEQTQIAADLASPLADVGCLVTTSAGSGFKRDRTYDYLQAGARSELLLQLSQVVSGPQFRAEYAISGGRPTCTLHIAYPRVGSGAAGLGVTMPGTALTYRAQWDSDHMRTRTFAVGDVDPSAAAGTPHPVQVVDAPQANVPRLDAADDYPGVILTSTLKEYATSSSQMQAGPAQQIQVTPSEAAPSLLEYGVGDDVWVTVQDELLPDGELVTGYLQQIDINAVAATAQWTVVTTPLLPVRRDTLHARLRVIGLRATGTFRSGPKTILP
jgi:hypothetical protein